jgi:stringent starvation protein B
MIIPTRPFLLRAFNEWILTNGWTPYIVVNSHMPGVSVPQQYVDEEGKIILNIGNTAAQSLSIGNEVVEFNARFSGVPMHIYAPISAVEAIYARENGRGIVFSEEEEDGTPPPPPTKMPVDSSSNIVKKGSSRAASSNKNRLKLIK